LVYNVFDGEFGKKLGIWQKPGDLDWHDHVLFIRKMEGGNLPLDRAMVTPVSITFSTDLKQVFRRPD